MRDFESALKRMKTRLATLNPGPAGPLPILIGGSGEKVTLRIVAEQADAWNAFGPPDSYAHKNAVLDEWCAKAGRDPAQIERTIGMMSPDEVDQVDDYLAAGATHLIHGLGHPFDLASVHGSWTSATPDSRRSGASPLAT